MLVAGYYPYQSDIKQLKGDIQMWENQIRNAKLQLDYLIQPHTCNCPSEWYEEVGPNCPLCGGDRSL